MLVCVRESNVVSYLVEALQSSQHLANLFNNFASSYLYIYFLLTLFSLEMLLSLTWWLPFKSDKNSLQVCRSGLLSFPVSSSLSPSSPLVCTVNWNRSTYLHIGNLLTQAWPYNVVNLVVYCLALVLKP